MNIYKAEILDGLGDAIAGVTSLAYETPLVAVPDGEFDRAAFASASESSDFYVTRDILVTTGWNLNGDVFEGAETWAARDTCLHKPFNFGHDQNDIIGHIINSYVADADLNPVPVATPVDMLPEKFHVVNDSVIYRGIGGEDRQNLIEQTYAEIRAGEWYVSMECHFTGFDYAVIDEEGRAGLVRRDASSAWLSKHLKAYGGDGGYSDPSSGRQYRIGRAFRGISFCGKGLVKRPGNPESLILSIASSFSPTPGHVVYLRSESEVIDENACREPALKEEIDMSDHTAELTALKAELSEAKATIASLNGKEVEKLSEAIADKDAVIAGLQAQVDAARQSISTLTERAEAAEAKLAKANEDVAAMKAATKKSGRMKALCDLGADSETAEKLVAKWDSLDDDAFNETASLLSHSWKGSKTEEEIKAIASAKVEKEPTMATASDKSEGMQTALAEWFTNNLSK